MSAAQVESRPTPSTAAAYDTPPATTSNSNPRSSTRPGPSGEPGSHRQGGGAGGAPGGGRDRRRRGKAPAAGAAESDHQGAQARGGGRNGGGGGRSGGAQAEVNGDSAAQQNGHRNQGASNRSANGGRGRGQGQGRPARGKANDGHAQGQTDPALDNAPGSSGANGGRQRQGRGKAKENPTSSSSADASAQPGTEPVAPISTRKRNFGGKITTDEADSTERGSADVKGKGVAPAPVPPLIREYADLRSRLVAELGSGQYESGHLPVSTRQMHNLPCKKTRKSALVVVPGDAQAANSRAKTCPRHTGAGAHASKIHKHVADSTRIPAVNAAGKDRVLMAAVRSHAILAHVLPAL
ncbi:unnamed protein product [Tilletia laevis]|uniref:Uncharacterized protein n=2 Tax=Tilletia TaxID=13289 RepID=A0A8X7N0Q2_9BASI|nr:hypothetical protein CF336_g146 [Tilletia laevis]KAE8205993.1 hypothetical protein CF328_g170 [Tilletia controversa]KAE8208665.1 hypothetical protein CF335_g248 [Tilletia laevis]KAE8254344.1 hypothetical protein A4X06_0g946 [Tilletia controversa]CAD6947201.1 unnamed protein product [Tilletia laevis]